MRKTRLIDLSGHRYDRLLVTSMNMISGSGAKWNCLCDCGNTVVVYSSNLRKKTRPTRSCGCLKIELAGVQRKTHGLTQSRMHTIWMNMKARCYNPKNTSYNDYGGKGVVVCDSWLVFENFYSDVKNGYKDHLTLDRYPNKDGNYSPDNFRWATQIQQQRNRRNNRLLNINGRHATAMEWSEISGTPYTTIKNRVFRKWSDIDCVFGKSQINTEYA